MFLLDDKNILLGQVNSRFPAVNIPPDNFPIYEKVLKPFYDTISERDQNIQEQNITDNTSDIGNQSHDDPENPTDLDPAPMADPISDSDMTLPTQPSSQPSTQPQAGPSQPPTVTRTGTLRRNPKKKIIFDL